jgi:hypothetical protein
VDALIKRKVPLTDMFTCGFHVKPQGVLLIVPHSSHEFIGKLDGNIHGFQLVIRLFNLEELIEVRMRTVEHHHDCRPAPILSDDIACTIE